MNTQINIHDTHFNPLDCVEDVLKSHNWVFHRANEDELMVQVAGKNCDYRLFFIWQDDMNALQFCCQYDLTLKKDNMGSAAHALMKINENLWMGHFDIPESTNTPSFRQTCLMRGMNDIDQIEHVESLIDISLTQCERNYSTFHYLAHSTQANDQNISLALMETSGQA